jgi:hypothetical protein
MMFENRVLKRIIGPKGGEVIEGWRKNSQEKIISCLLEK